MTDFRNPATVRALLDGTTPGKWRVMLRYSYISHDNSWQVVWDVPQSTGLSLVADTGGKYASSERDARLMVESPDLAAALADALDREARLRDILADALDAWDTHNSTGDGMQGHWEADARAALKGDSHE